MKKIRVGLLGGSFNPCHSGHLNISLTALKTLDLHEVWWMVSPQNPLKTSSIKSSFNERVNECKKFTKNFRKIKVKDLEYKFSPHAKKFYTYDLLKRLKFKFKDIDFILIIGADNLAELHKWKRYKDLAELAEINVFDRPGYKYKALSSAAGKYLTYRFINGKTFDISSTEIRNKK